MTGSSSEWDAATGHHGGGHDSLADDRPPNDQTLVLDSPDESTVPDVASPDTSPHPTMLLDDESSSGQVGQELPVPDEPTGHPLEVLQQAIAAAQSGNKILSRLHLEQAVTADPGNPIGWLWLAWVADSPTAAISALEQARPGFPDTALLEHGLAWARGMQDFRLELPVADGNAKDCQSQVPTTDFSNSETLHEQSVEVPDQGQASPVPATTPAETGEDAGPEPAVEQREDGTIPAAEIESKAPQTPWAEPAPGQTILLEEESAANGADGAAGDSEAVSENVDHDAQAGQTMVAGTDTPAEPAAADVAVTVDRVDIESLESAADETPESDSTEVSAGTGPDPDGAPALVDEPADGLTDDFAATQLDDVDAAGQDEEPANVDGSPSGAPPTILAIDDSPTVRSLVTITLQKCGYQVVTANDGMDALEQIKASRPDLILMDVNMPRLNGYQLCKLVKKHKEMRTIPVIMLSGKDGVFDKLRGNMCGCDDYITKPFESADLVRKVDAFLTGVEAHA